MSKKKDQGGKENPLNKINNDKSQEINRGLELLLRKNRRRDRKPKTIEMKFQKLVSLFNREISFYLNFHLDIRKINSRRD
jgi:hypothetical protein